MLKNLASVQNEQRRLMKGARTPVEKHPSHGKFEGLGSGVNTKSGIKDITWHHKGNQVTLIEHPDGDAHVEARNGKWERSEGKTPAWAQTDTSTHHFPSIKEATRHLLDRYGIDHKPIRQREEAPAEPPKEVPVKQEAPVQPKEEPVKQEAPVEKPAVEAPKEDAMEAPQQRKISPIMQAAESLKAKGVK